MTYGWVIVLSHESMTDRALADRRLPTLTEKPLAYTSADAARITQAFAAAGTPLQVGYMKRHYPAVSRLQDVISTHAVSTLAIVEQQ